MVVYISKIIHFGFKCLKSRIVIKKKKSITDAVLPN